MRETYLKTDKLPFGSFVAYNRLQSIFQDNWIETTDNSFSDTWSKIISYSKSTKYSLYFLIARNLVLDKNDLSAMMDYVKSGNDLFISANFIDNKLLESLYCNVDRKQEIINESHGKMKDTHVSIYFGKDFKGVSYGYYYFPFLNSIFAHDTAFARVLGVNEIGAPDYMVFFAGSGRIYLHVAPRIFSNYFLLTGNNYRYFENVISYLRLNPKKVYWDEYYKNNINGSNSNEEANKKKADNFSTLKVIKKNPPLLWAFWLSVGGMLIFVFLGIKRKQRVINIIKPNSNASIAFAETVGRLYLQHKNNRRIADKMITYFYENIRKKYFINTAAINDSFVNSLAGKSGVPLSEVNVLFDVIEKVQSQEVVEDDELLELNERIENFNNYKT